MNNLRTLLPLALAFACQDAQPLAQQTGDLSEDQRLPSLLATADQVLGQVQLLDTSLYTQDDLATASTVTVYNVAPDGSTTLAGSGALDASGRFVVDVDSTTNTMLAEVYASDGSLIAAAVGGASNPAERAAFFGRVGAESTVEALVFLEAASRDTTVETMSWVDVRNRVDHALTELTLARAEAEADGSVAADETVALTLSALAEATLVAQRTETLAMESWGMTVDTEAMLQSEVDAWTRAMAERTNHLEKAVDTHLSRMALSASQRGELTAQAELAFRATMDAVAPDDDDLQLAASRASVAAEARATLFALRDADTSLDAEAYLINATRSHLRALAYEATYTTADPMMSMLAFRNNMEGELYAGFTYLFDRDVDAVLGLTTLLSLDPATPLPDLVDALLSETTEARQDLEADVTAAATSASASDPLDVDLMAQATVDAWSTMYADTSEIIEAMDHPQLTIGTGASLMVTSMVQFSTLN